jgi:hypothetical protein
MKSKTLLLSLAVVCSGSLLHAEEPQGFERLVVQKSGGIAGIQDTYEITPDGKYKISGRTETKKGQLEGDQLKAFVAAVNAVAWAELPKKKLSPGADHFLYTVAIVIDGKYYSRTFHENAHTDNKPLQAFMTALAKVR